MTTKKIGGEGFRWFVGVVESRDDPLKLGRLKVRIYNLHSDKQSLTSTEELPWAQSMSPVHHSNLSQTGVSPTGIRVGATVVGFFMDGEDGNMPIIIGSLAGLPDNDNSKHDVPFEAREINKVVREPVGPEQPSPYAAKYPYNKVIRTEGGHVIEVDDTPTHERLHVYHTKGTYVEIDNQGSMSTKVVANNYQIIMGNDEVHIEGNINVYVKGNATIKVDGNVGLNVGGNYSAEVGGTYSVNAGGNMTFNAPKIDLN
jgi:hypothetical protein